MKNFTKKLAALSAAFIVSMSGGMIQTVSAASPTNKTTVPVTVSNKVSNIGTDSLLKITPLNDIYSLISDITIRVKLISIANGNVKLFSNDSGTFPTGSKLNNSKTYYVNGTVSGKQCYIYAQAVYWHLTGDYVKHGSVGSHSKKCFTNVKTTSYTQFKNTGVKPGAYIRTTSNSDGSYNGNNGHSMIVVSYDSSNITVLEGNGDGKGLVRTNTLTWSQFNKKYLTDKGRRISHVISPK